MAAVYGHVGPFDENTEKFAHYAGRYEAFVVANETGTCIPSSGCTTSLQVVKESM